MVVRRLCLGSITNRMNKHSIEWVRLTWGGSDMKCYDFRLNEASVNTHKHQESFP